MNYLIAGGFDYGILIIIIIAIISSLGSKKKKSIQEERKKEAEKSVDSFFTRSVVKPSQQKPTPFKARETSNTKMPSFEDIFEALFEDESKPAPAPEPLPTPVEIRPQRQQPVSSFDSKPTAAESPRLKQQISTFSGTDEKQEETWGRDQYRTTQLRDITYKQKDVTADLKDVNIAFKDVSVDLGDIGDSGIEASGGETQLTIDSLSPFQRAIIISEIFSPPVYMRKGSQSAVHYLLGRNK